jgi:low affinity Fe/Cu permease
MDGARVYHLEATRMRDRFRKLANRTADKTGSPGVFGFAFLIILIWAGTGHYYHYSDTWQLVLNTGTSIVTFLMVFLIQSTQNRDAKAMQLKLDELLRAVSEARTQLVALEDAPEEVITNLREEFSQIKEQAGDVERKIEEILPKQPAQNGR